ncbi:hypothetical protein N7537_000636 [Penicillium hordei]|uniref:Uncharacterized protein n=1 Tax=Penicillium hordei TaxID=40994 RepID=A0AAD6EFR5_9EURO|nr:uncharacterized protein N7537_000636 [Penicillium hordei]KAJ5615522.1 hypothetical protein N7537_000636 [Penicillium hordei]
MFRIPATAPLNFTCLPEGTQQDGFPSANCGRSTSAIITCRNACDTVPNCEDERPGNSTEMS